jgi:hypothetical protein
LIVFSRYVHNKKHEIKYKWIFLSDIDATIEGYLAQLEDLSLVEAGARRLPPILLDYPSVLYLFNRFLNVRRIYHPPAIAELNF